MNENVSRSLIAPLPDYLQKMVDESPVLQHAVEFGIDLTLLAERLQWSVTERFERHQAALEFFEGMRKAGQHTHDEL
jgi:hypothetical protein